MDDLPEEASPPHVEDEEDDKDDKDAASSSSSSTAATGGGGAPATTSTASNNGASTASAAGDGEQNEEELIEAMKLKMKQMQEEQERLEKIQQQLQEEMGPTSGGGAGKPASSDDTRSIYVGSVDYGATPEELKGHFQPCGVINRVTIVCNPFTGHPKGYAYIEFADEEAVSNALLLNETLFRGRLLKVVAKRTNVPGMAARGGYAPRGFRPSRRPFGGRRPRRPYFYQPY